MRPVGGALLRRALWHLRELKLPWEVPEADLVVTPLYGLLPIAARLRRLPVVVLDYGLYTVWERSGAARRRLLRASLGAAAIVVCLGEWQRDELLRQTGLDPERVETVRLGIDERFFRPQPEPNEGDPIVVAVGKDEARDYATLAEAVAPLGVRLELACLPRNLNGVRLPARARARFVGPEEVRDLYRQAACVVIPQHHVDYPYGSEGGGLTALLEAMASARPVVASDRPLVREYVEDGTSAVLVPPEDPDALRASISRVLDDRKLARSLGSAGRRRVEAGLTTRHFAERLAPILRRAAGEAAA